MTPDFCNLNPHLLLVNHIGKGSVPENCTTFGDRITRWHELDIITQGNGIDWVEGSPYPVTGGDIFYRTPGMHNRHDLPFNCYFFVFDPYYLESRNYSPEKPLVDLGQDLPETDISPIAPFSSLRMPRLGKASDPEKLVLLARQILLEFTSSRPDQLRLKILFLQLLSEISRQMLPMQADAPAPVSSRYWQEIRDLKDWMRSNPTEDLSMHRMAQRMGVSYHFFSRLFKIVTGDSFSNYASRVKLDYVKLQLLDTNKTISEIALECGYSDPNYLYILFRKTFGCTPSEYRLQNSGKI